MEDEGFASGDSGRRPPSIRALACLRAVFRHPGRALLFGLIGLVLVTQLNARVVVLIPGR